MIINTKKRQRNGNTHQPTDTYEIVPIVTYQLNGARPVKKYNQSNPRIEEKPPIRYDGTKLTMNTRNWLSLNESFEKY